MSEPPPPRAAPSRAVDELKVKFRTEQHNTKTPTKYRSSLPVVFRPSFDEMRNQGAAATDVVFATSLQLQRRSKTFERPGKSFIHGCFAP